MPLFLAWQWLSQMILNSALCKYPHSKRTNFAENGRKSVYIVCGGIRILMESSHRRVNLENSIPSNNKLIMWSNRIKIAVLLLCNYPSTCQDNFPPYTTHNLQYTLPYNTHCPLNYSPCTLHCPICTMSNPPWKLFTKLQTVFLKGYGWILD